MNGTGVENTLVGSWSPWVRIRPTALRNVLGFVAFLLAYAIACGTATAATVKPAIRSRRKVSRLYVRRESKAGTTR